MEDKGAESEITVFNYESSNSSSCKCQLVQNIIPLVLNVVPFLLKYDILLPKEKVLSLKKNERVVL